MDKIAFVGKVVARQDYETRIVLALLNKAQDKLTVSFFKEDKYAPPEVIEAFNGIAVGAAGTFYYTVSLDGKYKNLKGYDPSTAREEATPPPREPKPRPESRQLDIQKIVGTTMQYAVLYANQKMASTGIIVDLAEVKAIARYFAHAEEEIITDWDVKDDVPF